MMPTTISIVAISDGQNKLVSEAFKDSEAFALQVTPNPDANAIKTFAPQIIVLDGKTGSSFAPLIQNVRHWPEHPAIIALGELAFDDLRALISYPHADALASDISADQLRALAIKISTPEAEQKSSSNGVGECWVMTGAVGGAGVSMIAVETAYQLATRGRKDEKIALLDLNFEDGSLACYLDMPAGLDLQTLCAAPERMDEAMLQAFASEHDCGMQLIAAPRGADIGMNITADAVLCLLEIACGMYDKVVVDLPRWRRPWTQQLIKGADHIVIVSELTVPALHAARYLSEDLEKLSGNSAEPRIILNRMSKRVFGHSVTVSQAEKALQRKTLASVSSDWDAAATAVNVGLPVSLARPGSKISKDVKHIIDCLEESKLADITNKVA